MTKLIIDGGYFVHRTKAIPFFRNMVINDDRVGMVFGMLNTLKKLTNDGYGEFYVAWDKGVAKHRNDILDDYKGTRGSQTPVSKQEYKLVEKVLGWYNVKQYYHPELEADDVMGWMVNNFTGNTEIYTTDKDLYQMVNDEVFIHHPDREKILKAKDVKEEYGVSPKEIPKLLAIMGDKVDNIEGIKGIGQKTGAKYINEGHSALTDRQSRLIRNNEDIIEKNLKLTKLKLDIIPEEIETDKDYDKLNQFLDDYGFESLKELVKDDESKSKSFMKFVE